MKTPRPPDAARQEEIRRELHRLAAARRDGYRERALKLFPHVCASCGRDCSGQRLRELTVHHKDHNYKNNPPDGSNWELLCLYCHDHEHEKHKMAGTRPGAETKTPGPSIFSPFESLDKLLDGKLPAGGDELAGREAPSPTD